VGWFYRLGDYKWFKLNVVAGILVFFFSVFYCVKQEFYLMLRSAADLSPIRDSWISFFTYCRQKKQVVFIIVLIGLTFFMFYGWLGSFFVDTPLFLENDLLFQADHARAVGLFSDFHEKFPPRTRRHPVYVLFVNPAGRVLNSFLHSLGLTAVWLNAFLGGCAVALMFGLFLP
jgi:hypothetical protein